MQVLRAFRRDVRQKMACGGPARGRAGGARHREKGECNKAWYKYKRGRMQSDVLEDNVYEC